jgi:hypothetical protein
MAARDKLLEEYKREYNGAVKRLFLSHCHTTEQGVKKIKECQMPSTIEILMETRSSGTLSNALSSVVKDLIDQDSSIQTLVVQKWLLKNQLLILAKVCLILLIKRKFVRLKSNLSIQNPLERAQRLYLVLLCWGEGATKQR